MQKNILILWLWAFGFAVAKHLGENNPDLTIYASEINEEIYNTISETRMHPYFFEGEKLPENIELVGNTGMCSEERSACLQDLLAEIDIIISIIPCQFVAGAFEKMKNSLKDGVTILNLSKWIDNKSLQTVSEKLSEVLPPLNPLPKREGKTSEASKGRYTYAYLAGGMIASELVGDAGMRPMLWADIVTEDSQIWETLKDFFQSETLAINLKIWAVKNTELYAALKNIIALILGYYEGQWLGASTRWYYFSKLLTEMQWVIGLLSPLPTSPYQGEEQTAASSLLTKETRWIAKQEKAPWGGVEWGFDFTDYALSGDLVATCFGWSRNRLLGNMLGEWKDISTALEELTAQKKIAEGYETLKWVYQITKWKDWFEEINKFWERYL